MKPMVKKVLAGVAVVSALASVVAGREQPSFAPAHEPKVGAIWKVNLFRLERIRDGAKTRVIKNEASAWSSPLSGDFHNLDRFASITFIE